MSFSKEVRTKNLEFILQNIREHPVDIVNYCQKELGISRTTIFSYLQQMQKDKLIKTEGQTRNRKYSLLPQKSFEEKFEISSSLTEDKIWRENILPLLQNQKDNVFRICEYGFTEMFNNALDHSEGTNIIVNCEVFPDIIQIIIADNGVGIFNKIQKICNLDDPYNSILELSKGKLTTSPESHTGEGIFFTSRMFDNFFIISSKLRFGTGEISDYLWEDDKFQNGTTVAMDISVHSNKTMQTVFDKFADKEHGFDRTIVPVALVKYGHENLISRSQAKRMLNRLEKFKIVVLDFEGITIIGRAFADEVFRVFTSAHPDTQLLTCNTSKEIDNMISEIKNAKI